MVANGTPGGEVVAGSVYYGSCGTTAYAVARFQPGPDATPQESIAFQGAGSVAHYLVQEAGQPWRLVGMAPFPSSSPSCATFTELPALLRTAWQDCPQG